MTNPERDIYLNALKLTDPDARSQFLNVACGGDAALRARVEARLRAPDATVDLPAEPATAAFDPSVTAAVVSDHQPTDTYDHEPDATAAVRSAVRAGRTDVGAVIAGRYTLRKAIGEGGMGSVFLADQTEPVKRQVAVKLIRTGMDSHAVLARFDAERQALALMDHPNIARVYDGGTTDAGQPFFVMELVSGAPITEYCDTQRLPVKARLELFVSVCLAVQHAHQKGIIHRDLKPGNILVTEVDGRPTPKVIDFGVAKATEQKLTDMSFADTGAIVGTPSYMSPEQADPSSMDIDTRTDVYALGVILYELLVGTPPIEPKQFKRGAILEMLRMVREVDPPRPSTKLSTADARPNIAANRNTEPDALARLLRSEIDWIVLKALEKDRTRRYETANGFARDIQRYLADEVVEARPPSAGYRLKKFVRRHKGQVLAASLVFLTLVGGVIGTGIGLVKANEARDSETARAESEKRERERAEKAEAEATAQKIQAVKNADEATRQEKEAKDQLALANALTDFLRVDLLSQAGATAQANRFFTPKPNLTVREALDRAANVVGLKFGNRPRLEASIRHTLGDAYIQISEPESAVKHLTRALELRTELHGPEHVDTTRTLNLLGKAQLDTGRVADSVKTYTRLREIGEKQFGPEGDDTQAAVHNLALATHAAGQTKKAIALFEQVVAIRKKLYGEEDRSYLSTIGSLASSYQTDRQYEKAIELYEKVRDGYLEIHGPNHPDVILQMNNLAGAYDAAGRRQEALKIYEELLKRADKNLGPDHAQTLMTRHNLAHSYLESGREKEALPLFEELRPVVEKKLGTDNRATLTIQHNLARTYLAVGREDEAIALIFHVATRRKATIGIDHPDTILAFKHYGFFNWLTKHFDKGVVGFAETLEGCRRQYGNRHEETLSTAFNLAFNYRDNGQPAEVKKVLDEWMPHALAFNWKDRGMLIAALNLAVSINTQLNQPEANRPLVGRMKTELQRARGKDDGKYAGDMAMVGMTMLSLQMYDEAEPILREALTIRSQSQPNTWSTFNTQSMLGGALRCQKKYAEAEPLLLKGYEGVKAREKTLPPAARVRLTDAIDRLIEFYTATDKPDEVKKWKAERAKYPEIAPFPRAKK